MESADPTPSRERWLFLGSALVLLTALLVALGREQHWGEAMVPLRLTTPNSGGLRPGQEVRISGMPVGQITSLELQNDASVAVHLQVTRRHAALIGPKSAARQSQEGLVGDHFLEISADPHPAGRARDGSELRDRTIRYLPPVALDALMNQLLVTQQELQATLRNTHRLTGRDLPITLQEARRSLVEVRGLSAAVQREAVATAPELRASLRDTRQGLGTVGQLSTTLEKETRATAPELRQSLEQLRSTGARAEQASAEAQQLLQEVRGLLRRLTGWLGMEAGPHPDGESPRKAPDRSNATPH